jgi:hypothetical protein
MATIGKRPTVVRRARPSRDDETPLLSNPIIFIEDAATDAAAKLRRSFPETEDGGVRWDGFKSEKHRDAMRRLITREAEAMGYAKTATDVAAASTDDEKLNAAQLFTLLNVITQPLAVRFTGCTVEQAAILGIDDDDLKTLNKNGITDKMIEKYLPSVQVGLEITWTLAVLGVAAGKWADFNKLRLADRQAVEGRAQPEPRPVFPPDLIRAGEPVVG